MLGRVERDMKVGMITCWYKNLSMANYSNNLRVALAKRIDVEIVSSHCLCWQRFVGRDDIFEGSCRLASFPPYLPALEADRATGVFHLFVSLTMLFLQFLRGITYFAKCKNCDIIHYQQTGAYSFGMSSLFAILSIPTSKKRVVTVHGIDRLNRFRFFRRSYRNADRIIVHSSSMKKKMLSFGVPASKIRLVPHGAQLPPLTGLPRREITFFGAPAKRKGFLTVLQALKLLKAMGQEVRLHVYGIYSDAEKNEAIDAAVNMGVADLLVWEGRLSEIDFDKKMQESIFTLAVYSAPVSGSSIVTRAMANATPIIASTVGGVPEYLEGGGLLVAPNDAEAVALAITKLLNDARLRKRLSEEGRRRAETFTWGRIAEMTFQIYHECIQEMRTNTQR